MTRCSRLSFLVLGTLTEIYQIIQIKEKKVWSFFLDFSTTEELNLKKLAQSFQAAILAIERRRLSVRVLK